MVSSTSDLRAVAPAAEAETEADGRSANCSSGEHPSKLSQAGSGSGSLSLGDEEKQVVAQVGATPTDPSAPLAPNIVDWDGPDDPGNPVNFSGLIKGTNVGIVSALTFITPLASSMFAPGVPLLMEEFHTTNSLLGSFVVSVYVLGFAIGPLILAPASELAGRAIIYHICNLGFTVFTIACAVSTDMGMLITFRFFQGCFGSAPVTNGERFLCSVRCPTS